MLIENIDYYIDKEGNLVFTETYHLKRGNCCKNKCTAPGNMDRKMNNHRLRINRMLFVNYSLQEVAKKFYVL